MAFECANGDWFRKRDPETGSFYYANIKTLSSSWIMPPDWVEPARPPGVAVTNGPTTENWREVLDPNSGNYYYVNLTTLERQWVKPASMENLPMLDLRKPVDFDGYHEDIYSSDEDFKAAREREPDKRGEIPKSPRGGRDSSFGYETASSVTNSLSSTSTFHSSSSVSTTSFSSKFVFRSQDLIPTPRLEQAYVMSQATGPAEKSGVVKAIRVFMANEHAYFKDLQVIAMELEATLANQKKGGGESLNASEMKMILKNIPDLFALHLHFESDSESRTDAQIQTPEFIESIGQLVMSLEPYAFYISAYRRDCKSVLSFLERAELDRPCVKATLDHLRSTKCLTGVAKPIAFYLEAPASRPAVYAGLIFNILKTVDPLSDSFKLWHELLQKCEFVTQKIEENTLYISSRESVVEIQRRIHSAVGSEYQGLNLVTPTRFLVQSGEVRKKMDKARLGPNYKSYTLFVFNDLAMYASLPDKSRRIVPKQVVAMTDLRVEGSTKDVNFCLISPTKSVQFKVSSKEERDNWVKVIQECIKNVREATMAVEMRSIVTLPRKESARTSMSKSYVDHREGRKQSLSKTYSSAGDREIVPVSPEKGMWMDELHIPNVSSPTPSTERSFFPSPTANSYDRGDKNDRFNTDDMIRLNVGGTLFHTTSATLLNKAHHSTDFLTQLVAKAQSQDHPVFIDRDPEYFKVCLNYLRTGRLVLPSHLSAVLMSAELAHLGISEPIVSQGRVQQWCQGSLGETRRFEFHRTHCDCFTTDGRFKVCDNTRWQDPFCDGLPWRGIECAPAIIFTEMGKNGWEIKGYSQNSGSGPGDVAYYILQKISPDTYQASNETQGARKTSLNLRGPRKPKPI